MDIPLSLWVRCQTCGYLPSHRAPCGWYQIILLDEQRHIVCPCRYMKRSGRDLTCWLWVRCPNHYATMPLYSHIAVSNNQFIFAAMIVWRIRAKIIRTVLCCIVYYSCTQLYAHLYKQFLRWQPAIAKGRYCHVIYKLLYPSIRVRTAPPVSVRVSFSFSVSFSLCILFCMCGSLR